MSDPNRPYAGGVVNVSDVHKDRLKKMKDRKKFYGRLTVIAMILLIVLGVAVGFSIFRSFNNKQLFDMTWSYEYAIVHMPDGKVIEGHVDSWTDFEDGDQIQIKIDGVTYLTHSMNVVLLSE